MLFSVFQEQEENKSATSWPEYYIDQLNSMAAVSNNVDFNTFLEITTGICPLPAYSYEIFFSLSKSKVHGGIASDFI